GDVESAQRPEFLHMAGDLPHAPAEQPIEHENQFEVRIAVRLGLPRHALYVRETLIYPARWLSLTQPRTL
ncbi:hypothetical protein, partial [Burkholderia ubonensis]|uniref:hypothetical protein n=1 Tax=Burkholderia ubonensis TaxID=101571 RepID=UPI001C436235